MTTESLPRADASTTLRPGRAKRSSRQPDPLTLDELRERMREEGYAAFTPLLDEPGEDLATIRHRAQNVEQALALVSAEQQAKDPHRKGGAKFALTVRLRPFAERPDAAFAGETGVERASCAESIGEILAFQRRQVIDAVAADGVPGFANLVRTKDLITPVQNHAGRDLIAALRRAGQSVAPEPVIGKRAKRLTVAPGHWVVATESPLSVKRAGRTKNVDVVAYQADAAGELHPRITVSVRSQLNSIAKNVSNNQDGLTGELEKMKQNGIAAAGVLYLVASDGWNGEAMRGRLRADGANWATLDNADRVAALVADHHWSDWDAKAELLDLTDVMDAADARKLGYADFADDLVARALRANA